jgi:hypothetical protein
MKIRTLGWVLGAACLMTGGGFATIACSSSSPGATGSVDSGTSDLDTGSGVDSSSPPDMDAGGGGNDCGSTPHLHLGDGGSLYCPFGPEGGAIDCPTGSSICCIGGEISRGNYAVSQCGDPSQICPNPLPDAGKYPARRVECEESADCPAGDAGPQICCGTGGIPALDMACSYYRESPGFTAMTCTAGTSCPAGQFQICASDPECGTGHTCKAFKAVGLQLGFCQ